MNTTLKSFLCEKFHRYLMLVISISSMTLMLSVAGQSLLDLGTEHCGEGKNVI